MAGWWRGVIGFASRRMDRNTWLIFGYFVGSLLLLALAAFGKRQGVPPSGDPEIADKSDVTLSAKYTGEEPTELSERGVPQSWDFWAISDATTGGPGIVYVLAWSISEYEGHRGESCLTMRVLENDNGYGRWCASHLYFDRSDGDHKWRESMVHVTRRYETIGFLGRRIWNSKDFKERPGNTELYSAMGVEELNWSFRNEHGEKFVSCGVCEKSWLEVTGEKPTRFFEP